MGFPQISGTISGVPIVRIIACWVMLRVSIRIPLVGKISKYTDNSGAFFGPFGGFSAFVRLRYGMNVNNSHVGRFALWSSSHKFCGSWTWKATEPTQHICWCVSGDLNSGNDALL